MRSVLYLIAAVGLSAMNVAALAQSPASIVLPKDSTAAVITLDFRGGYGREVKDGRPFITVFANGAVRVVDSSGETPPVEARISSGELQGLLQFAIAEHHFFDFDSARALDQLRAEQDKSGRTTVVSDAPTTVIRIRTADRDHTGEFYALSQYRESYPTVRSLQDLSAIEQRIMRLAYETEAGGRAGIAAALQLANAYLAKNYSKVTALVPADFQYTRRYAGDRRQLIFRMSRAPDSSVVVEFNAKTPPRVTVLNPPR